MPLFRRTQDAPAHPDDMWPFHKEEPRHRLHQIVLGNVRLDIYRTRIDATTYAYQHDLFMRVRYEWRKVGTVHQDHSAAVRRLLTLAEVYLHGLKT